MCSWPTSLAGPGCVHSRIVRGCTMPPTGAEGGGQAHPWHQHDDLRQLRLWHHSTPLLHAVKMRYHAWVSLAGLAGNARTDARDSAVFRVLPPPGKFGCLRCGTKTPRRVVPLRSRIFSLVLWWTENRLFSPDPRGAPGCSCTGCSRCSCGCQLQSTADDCESKPRACRDGIPGL